MRMMSERAASFTIALVLLVIGVGFSAYSLYDRSKLEQQAKSSHEHAMQNGHDAMECELKQLDLALDLLACTAACPDWAPLPRPSASPSASALGL